MFRRIYKVIQIVAPNISIDVFRLIKELVILVIILAGMYYMYDNNSKIDDLSDEIHHSQELNDTLRTANDSLVSEAKHNTADIDHQAEINDRNTRERQTNITKVEQYSHKVKSSPFSTAGAQLSDAFSEIECISGRTTKCQ